MTLAAHSEGFLWRNLPGDLSCWKLIKHKLCLVFDSISEDIGSSYAVDDNCFWLENLFCVFVRYLNWEFF